MRYQVIIVGVVYLFTVVLPMLAIYFYQKVNGWSLRHLGHREKRIVPYAMTIASYVTCLLLMYRMGIPRFMSGILVSSLLAIVICALVNIWWKISVHMAAIGQFIGGMVSFSLLFYYDGVDGSVSPSSWQACWARRASSCGSTASARSSSASSWAWSAGLPASCSSDADGRCAAPARSRPPRQPHAKTSIHYKTKDYETCCKHYHGKYVRPPSHGEGSSAA